MPESLLTVDECGLRCSVGDFYIDPWRPVGKAVITHAHSDHAKWGHASYLCSGQSVPLLKRRLGEDISVLGLEYSEPIIINGVEVSLHPAGHILGSAQVRVEHKGEVWVASGDYKVQPDSTCAPFELVKCHTFITETTFGLPIYKWKPDHELFEAICTWWKANQEAGKVSVLYGYSLGKAQRLLSGLSADIGPIFTHGSVTPLCQIYEKEGVQFPFYSAVPADLKPADFAKAIVLAPPSAQGTPWLRRFGDISEAFASGWMSVRGNRRRRALDKGFALSDHVDWPSLLEVVKATGADRVLTTHGYSDVVSRYLSEQGLESSPLQTPFTDEEEAGADE